MGRSNILTTVGAAAVLFHAADARSQEASSGFQLQDSVELIVTLRDGPFVLGEINAVLEPDGSRKLNGDRFLELLAEVVGPEAQAQARTLIGPDGFISNQALEGPIQFTFDDSALEASIVIDPALRKARDINFSRGGARPRVNGESPAHVAAFVNVRTSLEYSSIDDIGFRDPNTTFETAVRAAGLVLEAQGSYTPSPDQQGLVRTSTRFVYDVEDHVLRLSAGDLTYEANPLQSNLPVGGFGIQRSYSEIAPFANVRPQGNRSLLIKRPSRLEVFVNGVSIRRVDVSPGTYSLSDLPTRSEINDVEVVVEDDTGKTEVIRFNVFSSSELLAVGIDEFSANLGFASNFAPTGSLEYDTGEVVFSGYYRRGLTSQVTGGVGLETNGAGQLLSSELVVSTAIGRFNMVGGVRHGIASGDTGYTTRIDYSSPRANDETRHTVDLSVETFSRAYGPLTVEDAQEDTEYVARARYDYRFPNGSNATLRSSIRRERDIAALAEYSIGASYGASLTKWASASFDVSYEAGAARDEEELIASASLSFRLSQRSRANVSWDEQGVRVRADHVKSNASGVGTVNYRASVDQFDDVTGLEGSVNYFSNRGVVRLVSRADLAMGERLTAQTNTLQAETAFAFADGAVAMGRPIGSSFAIVKGHRTLEGRQIRVTESVGGERPTHRAKTGWFGPALIGDLAAFGAQSIPIDVEDLPPGYDIGEGTFTVAPKFRTGYKLTVGSASNMTVFGVLQNKFGETLSLVSGKAFSESDPLREPILFFTNRAGRFTIGGVSPGRWRLEIYGESDAAYALDVPESGEILFESGALRPQSK